jgi:hypothetical protein
MAIKPTQKTIIFYHAQRQFDIGNVLYRIRSQERQVFRVSCRVCGGKEQITVNGVTFKCPCCDKEKEAISINKYIVQRYRVHSIEDEVPSLDWNASTDHEVKVKAYRKIGRYDKNNDVWEIYPEYTEVNPADIPYAQYDSELNRTVFDDYKIAVSVADRLSEREQARLQTYNNEHGTEYIATFNTKHDPK